MSHVFYWVLLQLYNINHHFAVSYYWIVFFVQCSLHCLTTYILVPPPPGKYKPLFGFVRVGVIQCWSATRGFIRVLEPNKTPVLWKVHTLLCAGI